MKSSINSAADLLKEIEKRMGESWLPQTYRTRILKMRTRAYDFPPLPKHAQPQIHHTLLGIELKVGRRRMLCPDLATARYLAVFTRVGCRSVAIPYDITRISIIADELESALFRMLLIADDLASNRSEAFRTRLRRQLVGKVREEIAAAGAGARVPEFKMKKQNPKA